MTADEGPATTVLLAGATGNLGHRIARALRERGARVRALARPGTGDDRIAPLRTLGAEPIEVDLGDEAALARAAEGADCLVSTLQGLRPVIVDTQARLLDAAVAAGVPRFIPSDFSLDFFRTEPGSNRNLDLRREFDERLDRAPIRATSILNGAFTELLKGPGFLHRGLKRVIVWGDPDQPLDFTTMDDTAAFTARAALDAEAPRVLRIAGDQLSARGLAEVASAATGERYRTLRAGGVGLLAGMIRVMKTLSPSPNDLLPAWQGMQYAHNMYSGEGKLTPLDNDRYGERPWTSVRAFLSKG